MGSLMSGWENTVAPPPLSVEEELKLQRPSLGRRSSTGSRGGSISDVPIPIGNEPSLQRPSLLSKVADMQQTGDGTGQKPTLKAGAPIRVHVKGTRGSTVVIDARPATPTTPNEEGEEGEEGDIDYKWWKKLPSSVLNDERESFEVSTEPASYMPQFDLTGTNPYVKVRQSCVVSSFSDQAERRRRSLKRVLHCDCISRKLWETASVGKVPINFSYW